MGSSPPRLDKSLYTPCMEDLDTVGWSQGFSFEAYGVRLGIRVDDSSLLAKLESRIPYVCKIINTSTVDRVFSVLPLSNKNHRETRYNLYLNHEIYSLNLTTNELLERFHAFSSIAIAELSTEKLFVHSGVVGWKDAAILLPGKSHAGKSTLVAELVKLGATYYSDEFALIDEDGYVSHYPKPLSLRVSGNRQQRDILIEEIGGRVGEGRLPISQVIFSEYKSDSAWDPDQLTPGQGVLFMLEHIPSAQRSPGRAMKILSRAISAANISKGYRGEAGEAAVVILDAEVSYYG